MTNKIQHTFAIPDELGGSRLDQAVAKLLPTYSRTQIQTWIKDGTITVNGKPAKAKEMMIGGEEIAVDAELKAQPTWVAEPITLDVIYEDNALIVINKPIGMVVHPGAGNYTSTLLNALLHHAPSLSDLPRAGIIHRLDKDTSGLLVIAKTPEALASLSEQMRERTITRIYQAIVCGHLISGGTIDKPIGRHPIQRKRMAINEEGKPAVTHFRVIEQYRGHTRLKVQLETGRTHQIRVHMASIQHPIFGDQTYGGRLQLPKGASIELVQALRKFKRQALHAYELSLIHPVTQKKMHWQAPLPADIEQLIHVLKTDVEQMEDRDLW